MYNDWINLKYHLYNILFTNKMGIDNLARASLNKYMKYKHKYLRTRDAKYKIMYKMYKYKNLT